jgi:ABC-type transport system involved in cytochrome c biogenesis permease subunit
MGLMELFFWGLGTVLAGVIFLILSYAIHKEDEQYKEQEKENSIWTRFIFISDKIENIKYAIGAIGLILIGIILILASLGLI